MAVTVKSLLTRAGVILHDTTQVRWQDTELLGWLNDSQRELVLIRPDASIKNEDHNLSEGTKQTLPAGGIRLIDVIRNNTTSTKNAVRVIDRNVLDAQQPAWHTSGANATVEHYMFDLRDPKHFYVYPAQPAEVGTVELVYSSTPVDAVLSADAVPAVGSGDGTPGNDAAIPAIPEGQTEITLDDIYANAMLDYILYRAYSKDADFAGNAQRALKHYEAFAASLGLKFQVDKLIDPNMQDNPVPAPQ